MSEPTISIIIPCYNTEDFIREAIDSILAQRINNLEILVIDDGSDHDITPIIKTYDQVELVQQNNAGPSAARNRGLSLAKGEFIAFLDADDLWPKHKLQKQLDYLNLHPTLDLVSGRIQCMGSSSDHMYTKMYENADQKTMLNFHLGASLYRRAVFDVVGPFDEELRYSEDVDHWFKIVENGLKFEFLNEITLMHRRHETNMTNVPLSSQNTYFLRALKKSMDRRKKLGSFKMPDFFQHALRNKKG